MNDAEKVAAFDNIAEAMTNQFHDGKWCWWNPTPACGAETPRETQAEALQDFVQWAARIAPKQRNKR